MDGFHQILCLQKIMYKRFACLGIGKWITEAGITKSASVAEKAAHGLHYNTTTRVYKEIFNAIVQLRTKSVANGYEKINKKLLDDFIELRRDLTAKNITPILHNSFHELQKEILKTTRTQSKMTVMLLWDISLMLSFIAAARESNIDLHLQCERQFFMLFDICERCWWTYKGRCWFKYQCIQHMD